MPPELINGEKYRGPEVDIWTLGTLLFEITQGTHIFSGDEEIMNYDGNIPKLDDDPVLQSLVQGILQVEPAKRMTISEIKAHPWMVDYYDAQV